jgi:hypothetical protein
VSSILTPIFGLVGVIVGAIVTGGVQAWSAARGDWLDLRVARRQVRAELDSIKSSLQFVTSHYPLPGPLTKDEMLGVQASKFMDIKHSFSRGEMLDKHGDLLARYLSPEQWDKIDIARSMLRLMHEYEAEDILLGRLDGVERMFGEAMNVIEDRKPPWYLLIGVGIA